MHDRIYVPINTKCLGLMLRELSLPSEVFGDVICLYIGDTTLIYINRWSRGDLASLINIETRKKSRRAEE